MPTPVLGSRGGVCVDNRSARRELRELRADSDMRPWNLFMRICVLTTFAQRHLIERKPFSKRPIEIAIRSKKS